MSTPTTVGAMATAPVDRQRMWALDRANEVRVARAALKRGIACGDVSVAAVVVDPPAEALGMLVSGVVRAQPMWGRVWTMMLLRRAEISESKLLGELTQRQRRQLVAALGDGRGRR